jgi:hypothetical protein
MVRYIDSNFVGYHKKKLRLSIKNEIVSFNKDGVILHFRGAPLSSRTYVAKQCHSLDIIVCLKDNM